ncbi:hypothetical protein WJX73_010695 [Symbiochloris irregularis]|uniref:Alkyl transferase n=1 Tax=Symbiochloris irregularis TaxID=706552 RepID=A0AAW1Q313_9CHLO
MILSPSYVPLALWRWFYARYRGFVAGLLKLGPIPTHVGFIMDGNRRYARKSSVERSLGHRHGFTKLLDILEWCLELGVSNVTVFAFGEDNFKRSDEEVTELMSLAEEKLWQLLEEPELVARHGIRVKVLGNLNLLPEAVQRAAEHVMQATNQYNQVTLNICLAYSSKKEMNKALKAASKVDNVEDRVVVFQHQLGTKGQPPVDLLVRTSGETRLSDFLLWQCATAHLVFSRALWPEFTYLHLLEALLQYQQSLPALAALRSEWEKWLGYSSSSRSSSPGSKVPLNGDLHAPQLIDGEAVYEAASTEAANVVQLLQDTGAQVGQLAVEAVQDAVSTAEAATSSALTHGLAGEAIPGDIPEDGAEGAPPTRSHHRGSGSMPPKSMPLRRQASMMSQGSMSGSEQSFGARSSTQDREDEIVRAAFTPGQHASMGAETHPDDCPACALAKKMPRHRALSMPMSSAVQGGPSHHLWHNHR